MTRRTDYILAACIPTTCIPVICILAGMVTVLWVILQLLLGGGFYGPRIGSSFAYGLAGMAVLIFGAAAWKCGERDEDSYNNAILFSLVGLFSPVIGMVLCGELVDPVEIVELLLFLSPSIPAYLIGNRTRRCSYPMSVRMALNMIPVLIFIGIYIGVIFASGATIGSIPYNIPPIAFLIIVTVLSAYAEAKTDFVERRRIRWNCWCLFLLMEILIGIRYTANDYYGSAAGIVFARLLKMLYPLLLWQWIGRLSKKEYKDITRKIIYFSVAFVLNILQAGGLYFLMTGRHIALSVEWMLIGTIMTLAVYWQKKNRVEITGVVCSIVLVLLSIVVMFMGNERLREIVYNLGGPAVRIGLYSRADWIGYRINAVRAFISGNFISLYEKYIYTSSSGFADVVDEKKTPYAILIVILILVLTVLMSAFMKREEKRKLLRIFALSLMLQTVIALAEKVMLINNGMTPAFTGFYITDFVLLYWILKQEGGWKDVCNRTRC